MAVGAYAADSAADQSLQEPLAGFGSARAPLAVVLADSCGGGKHLVGDNGRDGDGDPLFLRSRGLLVLVTGSGVGDGLGAVEVDAANVGLVT